MITPQELEESGFTKVNANLWVISNNLDKEYVAIAYDTSHYTQNVRIETYSDDLLYNTISLTIHDIKELRTLCLSLLRGAKYWRKVNMSTFDFVRSLIICGNQSVDHINNSYIWCDKDKKLFSWYRHIDNTDSFIIPTSDGTSAYMFSSKEYAEQDLVLCSKLMEK